ncbi:hypothetical protein BGZ49_001320 [Haplosporangium sp. Z 27]|nr:hypothetical protein BGZ49_001320 [Haplosporangium sp. Z 27]
MTTPLDIPEILGLISKHLRCQDQVNCLRVSRNFYNIFVFEVWRFINVKRVNKHTSKNPLYPVGHTLEKHKHRIQAIEFQNEYPQEYFGLRGCSRLQTLILHYPTQLTRYDLGSSWEQSIFTATADLISAHASTIRNVTIDFYADIIATPPKEIWDALCKCPVLNQLHLSMMVIPQIHMAAFLQVCSKAQSLTIRFVVIPEWPSGLDEANVDYISNCRDVKIIRAAEDSHYRGNTPHHHAMMIRRFHNIQSLDYRIEGDQIWHLHKPGMCATSFVKTLSRDHWLLHRLENLNLASAQINDDFIAALLSKMSQLKSLNVSDTPFGPKSLKELLKERSTIPSLPGIPGNQRQKRLCECIEELDVSDCRNVNGPMIQTILESCPRLIQFFATTITIADVASGNDWACTNITAMTLYLAAEKRNDGAGEDIINSDFFEMQRIAYSRLATLKRLRTLVLTEDKSVLGNTKRTLDLKLVAGLGLLSGLKEMREFMFPYDLHQEMNEAEAYWIIGNWPHLTCLTGVVNESDFIRGAFGAILNSKNIILSNAAQLSFQKPLDLLEVVERIAKYLEKVDRVRCLSLKRAFYAVLTPFVWRTISILRKIPTV